MKQVNCRIELYHLVDSTYKLRAHECTNTNSSSSAIDQARSIMIIVNWHRVCKQVLESWTVPWTDTYSYSSWLTLCLDNSVLKMCLLSLTNARASVIKTFCTHLYSRGFQVAVVWTVWLRHQSLLSCAFGGRCDRTTQQSLRTVLLTGAGCSAGSWHSWHIFEVRCPRERPD